MLYKQLFDGTKIPALGFGTWEMGGRSQRNTTNDNQEIEAIHTAIEKGLHHIDTAEKYGSGHSEELVYEATKDFNRNELFLTSKVSPMHLRYDELLFSAEQSLKRLGTDYLDLYLIHEYNPKISLNETMKAMNRLVDEKMVRYIGVSNFQKRQMKEAQYYSHYKVAVNQVEYSLVTRNKGRYNTGMENEILPYCQKNNIIFIAWRPLGKGAIAAHEFPLMEELKKKYNKTAAQIAINWLLAKDKVITIPKASKISHLEDNLGALGWSLSEEDVKRLDKGI
ncbi:MAG: aldo/keto reductase [Bacteroidales bacterium]|nr:aldo/keto reductase [Bacteroidales bacterium]